MSRANLQAKLPVMITAVVFLALYLGAGLHFDNFLTLRVFFNQFSTNSFLGIVAVGMTFVILTGGIDLSVGSMIGCTSIMAASLMKFHHVHPLVGLGIPLLFGILIGYTQGVLVAKFSLPPFLVTLAGLFFCRGVALFISQETLNIEDEFFKKSLSEVSFHITDKATVSVPSIIFILVVAVGMFVSLRTPFGRNVFAIGGNRQSAELMGLPVRKTLIGVYTLSGFLGALGGAVFTIFTSSGNATSATGLELDAIAAAVIGGTLLSGGYGSVFGTLLGVGILGVVQTAIAFDGNLNSWWTKIVIGALLMAFMLVQKGIERAATRKVTV